jgi:hypothetical protein
MIPKHVLLKLKSKNDFAEFLNTFSDNQSEIDSNLINSLSEMFHLFDKSTPFPRI